jgi:putrescine transport system ATP-binding protein
LVSKKTIMAIQSKYLSTLEPWQDPKAQPYVTIKNLTKSFGGRLAVNDVSLSIYKGELFSLLGRSGCGKSTLLRMLAGFESPTSGKIYIDGIDMTDTPAYKRPVSMVFQSYALFPHMTVEQNVACGLIQEGMPESEIKIRVEEYLGLVQMLGYERRKPDQLSGGERQRVALARSLIKHPKLVLLDEPLAALDKKLRESTQLELVNIQEKVGVTFIMVSHDQEEAMTMSTRIGLMNEGRILQIGGPTEIYEYPNSKYVANFIGSVNLFDGILVEEQSDCVIVKSTAMEKNLYVSHAASVPVGAQISVAIRPEKVMLTTTPPKGEYNWTSGVVKDIVYLGDVSIYHVKLRSGITILATVANLVRAAERPIQWEDEVYLYWKPENGIVLAI